MTRALLFLRFAPRSLGLLDGNSILVIITYSFTIYKLNNRHLDTWWDFPHRIHHYI
ncbi:hypothetical protein D9M71_71680 [compost metagenome]